MNAIFSITSPIFLLILIGYLAVRFEIIPKDSLFGLSRFVLYLALPALVFTKLSQMEVSKLAQVDFLAVYGIGSFLTLLVGLTVGLFLFKESLTLAGIKALGVSMPNSVFIGYPLLLQAFATPPTEAFAMAVLVENIILMPTALIILEFAIASKNTGGTLSFAPLIKRIFTNPIILSVISGIVASLLELKLPSTFAKSFDILAGGSAAVALIVIGGSLVGTTIKGDKRSIAFIAFGKLIIHPLMIIGLLQFFPDMSSDLAKAAIIIAATPMLSIFPIIGGIYGQSRLCASALMITTCLAFISLSSLLWFLQ